jgi:NADH:ubiquinone oxidoreductase subunit F (NADH-binding)
VSPTAPVAERRVPGLPRLLAGIPAGGALGLPDHIALHGELPRVGVRRRRATVELIEQVERAGLRGRGGGGFPTATKLRAVAGARGRPIVLVNAAEGEPASFKDRTLLGSLPQLVLDGAVLAARAVGADEIVVAVCGSAPAARDGVAGALAERERLADRGRLGGGDEPRTRILTVPNRYVAGQESALVNHVNGGPALPTFTPPRPSERGVRQRPTLVSNPETLAHLALIARHGPEWFRELGTLEQPGSALVSISGPVPYPGVYEIEHGAPLSALIDAAGGLEEGARLRALLVGGYTGAWIDGRLLSGVTLCDKQLAPYGATLGTGVVALLSTDACPVAELARVTHWLAAQSTGQCGPCVFGLDATAATIERIALGAAEPDVRSRLAALAALVAGRGACSHPDGVARLVSSALGVFADELADHARHGPCGGCERPSELPRPRRSEGHGPQPAQALSPVAGW